MFRFPMISADPGLELSSLAPEPKAWPPQVVVSCEPIHMAG